MTKGILVLETLTCPSCLQKIEAAIKQLKGVQADKVKIYFNSSKVKLWFDPNQIQLEEIKSAIEKIGYPVLKMKEQSA